MGPLSVLLPVNGYVHAFEDRAVDEKAEGPPYSLASEVLGILKKKKKKDNKDFLKEKNKEDLVLLRP